MAGRELRGDLFLLFTSVVRWQVRIIVCVGGRDKSGGVSCEN